jgi:hypothetical protein
VDLNRQRVLPKNASSFSLKTSIVRAVVVRSTRNVNGIRVCEREKMLKANVIFWFIQKCREREREHKKNFRNHQKITLIPSPPRSLARQLMRNTEKLLIILYREIFNHNNFDSEMFFFHSHSACVCTVRWNSSCRGGAGKRVASAMMMMEKVVEVKGRGLGRVRDMHM